MVVAVVGPTASGKTDTGLALCQALGGEVVSMDSMQVYRGMDVGTAKPTVEERKGIAHHLLDVVEPGASFSVAEYRMLADDAIHQIHVRNKLPVLVGGTGLYLNALTLDMDFAQATADPSIRAHLQQIADAPNGKEHLHAQLAEIDPLSARRLHVNDVRRVMRALEIYLSTGRTMTEQAIDYRTAPRKYIPIIAGLDYPREQLYARINERVHKMLSAGLRQEVAALDQLGVPWDCQAMRAIGYQELRPVLHEGADMEDAVSRIQQATRQYAKRQQTWFRRDQRVHWFRPLEHSSQEALYAQIIEYVRRHVDAQTPSSSED